MKGAFAAAALAGLAVALPAEADPGAGLDGMGRVSSLAGWRYTPNGFFLGAASDAGYPAAGTSPGGPAFIASFGYGATELIEAQIELFGSGERLNLSGLGAFNSFTYGGMAGVRLQWLLTPRWWARGLQPFVSVLAGPTVVDVSGGGLPLNETLMTGYSGGAGVLIHLSDRWAVNVELKYVYARGFVPPVNGGINGGGFWAGAGLSWLVPHEASSPQPNDMPSLPNG